MDPHLQQQELVDGVDVLLVLSKDQHRGRCLLQAVQQVGQLVLLLDVLNLLDNVQVGCTCTHTSPIGVPLDLSKMRLH